MSDLEKAREFLQAPHGNCNFHWIPEHLTAMALDLAALLRAEREAAFERAANVAEEEDACQTEYRCDTGERAAAAIRALKESDRG